MSPTAAIAANAVLIIAILAVLWWSMARPRRVMPHHSGRAAGRSRRRRLLRRSEANVHALSDVVHARRLALQSRIPLARALIRARPEPAFPPDTGT